MRSTSARPTVVHVARVFLGAALIGLGVATLAEADLGLASWTVLQQGVSVTTGLALGTATMLVTACVLLVWVPMRVKPGWGTIIAAATVGPTINVAMDVIESPTAFWMRLVMILASTALVGVGTGLYLTAGLGPGARDGLMTGLHRMTGWSIRRVRFLLEVGVVVLGYLLGGTLGLGTVVYTIAIGPVVQGSLRLFDHAVSIDSGGSTIG